MKKLIQWLCFHDMKWYTNDVQGRRIDANYNDVRRTYYMLPNAAYKQCIKCGKTLSCNENHEEAIQKINPNRYEDFKL